MAGAKDLCKLDDVKAWLDLKTQDADPVLVRLIVGVSAHIESWLSRPIADQVITDVFSGHGGAVQLLRGFPIISVASVVVDGTTLAPSTYTFTEDSVILSTGTFTRGRGNITITYTAGFVAIPADIEQAAIEVVAIRFKERGRIGITTQALAGGNTSYAREEFPPHIKALLMQWRRVTAC